MTGASGTPGTPGGGFHRPPRVAVVTVDASADTQEPRVYLSTMPSGPILVLGPPAADIWRAAVEVHEPRAVVGAMAEIFGVGADEIHDDVMGFLDELRDGGLLEWRDVPEAH